MLANIQNKQQATQAYVNAQAKVHCKIKQNNDRSERTFKSRKIKIMHPKINRVNSAYIVYLKAYFLKLTKTTVQGV